MADLWEKVKKTVGEIYTTASGKAVEGVNLGVKKLDEANIRRELSREFASLGGRAYQILKSNQTEAMADDPTIRQHLDRLEELERRLEEKEREIQEIRQAGSADPSADTEQIETQAETRPEEKTRSPENESSSA